MKPRPKSRALAAVLLLAGCAEQARSLPPAPTQLKVTMNEFNFKHARQAPKGRLVIRAINAGQLAHQITLVLLPEDYPPIKADLTDNVSRSNTPIGFLAETAPSDRSSFAVDLPPGRYALICFSSAGDGELHSKKAMGSELRVT